MKPANDHSKTRLLRLCYSKKKGDAKRSDRLEMLPNYAIRHNRISMDSELPSRGLFEGQARVGTEVRKQVHSFLEANGSKIKSLYPSFG